MVNNITTSNFHDKTSFSSQGRTIKKIRNQVFLNFNCITKQFQYKSKGKEEVVSISILEILYAI
jgi:hypothetical protein